MKSLFCQLWKRSAIYIHLQQTLICCTACLQAPSILGCSIDISGCSTIVSYINHPAEPLETILIGGGDGASRNGASLLLPSRAEIGISVDTFRSLRSLRALSHCCSHSSVLVALAERLIDSYLARTSCSRA